MLNLTPKLIDFHFDYYTIFNGSDSQELFKYFIRYNNFQPNIIEYFEKCSFDCLEIFDCDFTSGSQFILSCSGKSSKKYLEFYEGAEELHIGKKLSEFPLKEDELDKFLASLNSFISYYDETLFHLSNIEKSLRKVNDAESFIDSFYR